jgi:AcrR family transcriptional regulator
LSASDAPLRDPGLRTRSGNAMLRTRAAILEAAATCVEQAGVKRTTMASIAATGGVAKATLYNHFRTKDDVLAALVDVQVAALAADCAALAALDPLLPGRPCGLAPALEHAVAALAAHRPLRRVAAEEPALLLPLLLPDEGRSWDMVRVAVAGVLQAADAASGPAEVELVLRWLAGQLLWPAGPETVGPLVRALAPGASAVPEQGTSPDDAHPVGLGWPGGPARLRTT